LYDTQKFCGGLWGEQQRIETLKTLGMLDTAREDFYDRITDMLMKIFDTQCSHLVLIDPTRCWFKSWGGLWHDYETTTEDHGTHMECPREEGWCNYILVPHFAEILIIEDAAQDARLALNPFVVGPPHVRFYAGAPLVGSRGERYGTLCVADLVPRKFKAEAYSLLINFAHLVVEELERSKPVLNQITESQQNHIDRSRHLDLSLQAAEQGICMLDMRDSKWPMMYANAQFEKTSGLKDVIGKNFWDLFECNKQTRLEFGIATGLGDAFKMHIDCPSTGKSVEVRLLPATSDRLAPSKATNIPAWVDYQDDPPLSKSVQDRIMTKGDKDTVVRDCKCFWFVVICDQRTLTEDNLKNAGYRSFARQPSGDSTRTGTSAANDLETSSVMSSLSSSWSSFYGDYPLPPKLNGVLELGPLLGSGSFGKAYRAMSKDKEAMAVKVVDCRKRDDKAIQEQLKEVQLSAALKHPNVVKTLEYATSTGSTKGKQIDILWIVQELCELGNLTSAIERGFLRQDRKITAPADMDSVRATLRDIAQGMMFVHASSVIHADLTGRNVLLSSADTPPGFVAKVADFGLARYCLGGKGLPATDIGTITHMPPELMDPEGGALLPEADIWAFGILAWEAFHGKACYQGKNPAQIVISVFRGNTPKWTDGPEDFVSLMKRCISYKPGDRPRFAELVESLTGSTASAGES